MWSQDELVMYGDYGQVSPMGVPSWHLAALFNSVEAALLPSEVRWGAG